MSTPQRFEAIAELDGGLVLAVPEGSTAKKVITGADRSREEIFKYLVREFALKTPERAIQAYGSDKPAHRRARYRISLHERLRNRPEEPRLRIKNRGRVVQRYADLLADGVDGADQGIVIRLGVFGEASINPLLTYKAVDHRLDGDENPCMLLFQPSRHLRDDGQLWALERLTGERAFADAVKANGYVVDERFVEEVLNEYGPPFYLSSDRARLFAAPLPVHKEAHGPLKKMTARQALKYLPVPGLERVVERGSALL